MSNHDMLENYEDCPIPDERSSDQASVALGLQVHEEQDHPQGPNGDLAPARNDNVDLSERFILQAIDEDDAEYDESESNEIIQPRRQMSYKYRLESL